MPNIDFWFSIGSTYSYLSVMRLAKFGAENRVAFRWRPFNVRSIMIEMDNIPFAKKPVKAAYMWRDIERRAGMYGLSPRFPVPYPLKELERAGLLIATRQGRFIRYAVHINAMRQLLTYLTEDCCQGQPELCGGIFQKSKTLCSDPRGC